MYLFVCVHLLWHGHVHVEIRGLVGPRDVIQIARLSGKCVYLQSQLTSLKLISSVLQYWITKVQPVTNMEFTLKIQSECEVSNKKNLFIEEIKQRLERGNTLYSY